MFYVMFDLLYCFELWLLWKWYYVGYLVFVAGILYITSCWILIWIYILYMLFCIVQFCFVFVVCCFIFCFANGVAWIYIREMVIIILVTGGNTVRIENGYQGWLHGSEQFNVICCCGITIIIIMQGWDIIIIQSLDNIWIWGLNKIGLLVFVGCKIFIFMEVVEMDDTWLVAVVFVHLDCNYPRSMWVVCIKDLWFIFCWNGIYWGLLQNSRAMVVLG